MIPCQTRVVVSVPSISKNAALIEVIYFFDEVRWKTNGGLSWMVLIRKKPTFDQMPLRALTDFDPWLPYVRAPIRVAKSYLPWSWAVPGETRPGLALCNLLVSPYTRL